MRNPHVSTLPAAAFLALSITPGASFAGVEFTTLGLLPGDFYSAVATAVSADGEVVVGHSPSRTTGSHSFRWTAATGIVPLDDPADTIYNPEALALSDDGTAAAGIRYYAYGYQSAFKWTQATGVQTVEAGFYSASAYGISGDGQTVVGETTAEDEFGQVRSLAFRRVAGQATDVLFGRDEVPGLFTSRATTVSANGEVVGGWLATASGVQGFRWSSGDLTLLGDLPGGTFRSAVNDMSASGEVLVGTGNSGGGAEAFRWTATEGMVGLGFLDGATQSAAVGVSADGSIIVGQSGGLIFVWDEVHGLRSLDGLLASHGLVVHGLTGLYATGISGDGTTLVGRARDAAGNLQAWRVKFDVPLSAVPEPSAYALLAGAVTLGVVLRRRTRSGAVRP